MSKQPRDDGNAAIPVLGYRPGTGQQLVIAGTANRSAAFHPSTRVISVYADADCFIEIGNDSVVANLTTSHIVPAGLYMDISLGDSFVASGTSKYISCIGLSDGILHISERQ
jgi:hypothetical protein